MEHFEVILLLGHRLYDDGTPDLNTLARVRMAADLSKRGVAPVIVSTGYKGFNNENHNTTQADVMADLLVNFGIPNDCIIRENRSRTTWENLCNTKKLLGKEHFTAAVATSDAQMTRALYMCKRQGITAKGFPAQLPHDKYWRARNRLERLFTFENHMGWSGNRQPKWFLPIRDLMMKRDKRVSNETFEVYNAALREQEIGSRQ